MPQSSPAQTNGTGSAIACFDAGSIAALVGAGECNVSAAGMTNNFFPLGQQFYSVASGTSHATPAVAGACALLRQYFINNGWMPPSPAMTKACLMNSARYLNGAGANDTLWSRSQGMGGLDLGRAFDGAPRILHDQVSAEKFTETGQTRTFTGTITNSSLPFRVTLAWTDAPGSPNAARELVNDLDLSVTIGGVTYLGNVFSGAISVAGGAADSLNNVESVFLPAGITGSFIITVKASNLTADGVPDENPSVDQDFALVVYNATETWVPVVQLDSTALLAENCSPANTVVDPGETVTVAFGLRNVGTSDTSNLVATLLQTNGVALPSTPQTYGTLLAGGTTVTQAYSFTAGGWCGTTLVPVLQLQDGPIDLGNIETSFRLGNVILSTNANSNSNNIQIPHFGSAGPASPYPSEISLSGITDVVTKVTVTLAGLSHGAASDLDVLLVGPPDTNGFRTNVMLMSNCSETSMSNLTLGFDDAAATMLPDSGSIASGTYQPSGYYAGLESLPSPLRTRRLEPPCPCLTDATRMEPGRCMWTTLRSGTPATWPGAGSSR